jgi:hypothetical protein
VTVPKKVAAVCSDNVQGRSGKRARKKMRALDDGFVIFSAPCNSAQQIGHECIARNGQCKKNEIGIMALGVTQRYGRIYRPAAASMA